MVSRLYFFFLFYHTKNKIFHSKYFNDQYLSLLYICIFVLIRLLSHWHMLTLYRKQLWVTFCPRGAFQFIHFWNSIRLWMLSLKLARHLRLCRQQTVRNLSSVWNRVIKREWDCVNVLNDAPVGLHAGNGWIFGVNVMCNAGDFGLVN